MSWCDEVFWATIVFFLFWIKSNGLNYIILTWLFVSREYDIESIFLQIMANSSVLLSLPTDFGPALNREKSSCTSLQVDSQFRCMFTTKALYKYSLKMVHISAPLDDP
jgi:hypothetical protein